MIIKEFPSESTRGTEALGYTAYAFLFLLVVCTVGYYRPSNGSPQPAPAQDDMITGALYGCLNISRELSSSFIVFDTAKQSCGLVRPSDHQKLIDDILERDRENQIVWIVDGKARRRNMAKFVSDKNEYLYQNDR